MMSRGQSVRSRKRPEERREEILATAAAIALTDGLERITLRAVAERLGVRPGLITHYFPVAEDLVTLAFVRAAEQERERFFVVDGAPIEQLAHFIARVERGASMPLAKFWLNARHLARFRPGLEPVLREQDELDRAELGRIVRAGVESGDFAPGDVEDACIRILLAVDGKGSYANSEVDPSSRAFARFVEDVAAWALRMPPERLRAAIDATPLAPPHPSA